VTECTIRGTLSLSSVWGLAVPRLAIRGVPSFVILTSFALWGINKEIQK